MNNPLIGLISLFDTLLEECDERMLQIIDSGQNDIIYISAPDVLITLFKTAIIVRNYLGITKYKRATLFNSNNLVPSFDWAVTIYHKDYSLYKYPWMIRKTTLNEAISTKEGLCNKSIIFLNDLITSTANKVQLN